MSIGQKPGLWALSYSPHAWMSLESGLTASPRDIHSRGEWLSPTIDVEVRKRPYCALTLAATLTIMLSTFPPATNDA
jgi:hypothetical protein